MPYQVSLTESTTPIFATFLKGFVVVAAIGGLIILCVHTYARETYWFAIAYFFVFVMVASLFGLTQYLRLRQQNRELIRSQFENNREVRSEVNQLISYYREMGQEVIRHNIAQLEMERRKAQYFISDATDYPSKADAPLPAEEAERLRRETDEQVRREREEEFLKSRTPVGFTQGYKIGDTSLSPPLSPDEKQRMISEYQAEVGRGRGGVNDLQKFAVWKRIAEDKLSTVEFMQTFNRIK